VVPLVRSLLDVTSVADFGCGTGGWLAVWNRLGVKDIAGCDGPYVPGPSLLIDPIRFVVTDLARPMRLGRRFDLVQSLEVAEHLPRAAAPSFVETLTSHAPVVLFSAAAPGQGGERHVNEQPLEYWRALFGKCGFNLADPLRPYLKGDKRVESWYRYNAVFFVKASLVGELSRSVRASVISDREPAADYVPLGVRLGRQVTQHLPEPAMTWLARQVRRVEAAGRRSDAGPAHAVLHMS
jgi:SAM-dependent methyltransferase